MQQLQNYINGEFISPISDEWIDNYDPSKGEVYSKIPRSKQEDVELAFDAAKQAFPEWSNTTLEERSKVLLKIANLLQQKLVDFAKAESKDNGKPLSLALNIDIPRAISNFEFYAHALTQFGSESH